MKACRVLAASRCIHTRGENSFTITQSRSNVCVPNGAHLPNGGCPLRLKSRTIHSSSKFNGPDLRHCDKPLIRLVSER
jgi:hypothetical protein